jgi:integrase/recombinase XerD
MLTIYRRHKKECEHRSEGRKYRRYRCPIWVDGFLGSQEIRKSLDTADWQKAQDAIRDWESKEEETKTKAEPMSLRQAKERFLADATARRLNDSTIYKYRLLFKQIGDFADRRGLRYLKELDLTTLDDFRTEWRDGPRSSLKNSNGYGHSCDSARGGSGSMTILPST